MMAINLRCNELDEGTNPMSFVLCSKLLTGFLFISLLQVSFEVKAQEQTQTVAEQRALLASGPWICAESEDEDGNSYNSFDQYLPNGGYSGMLLFRSPDIDLDIIYTGEWDIDESGFLTHPGNGWFSIQNGLYSEKYGEEGYDLFVNEMTLEYVQLLSEVSSQKIILLTEEKFSYLGEGELYNCVKADRVDIRQEFGVNIVQ
jgi:hypothetical protein